MIKLIAHRGLMYGPDINIENKCESIDRAISAGFDAEIDVWVKNGEVWLGHDFPQQKICYRYIVDRAKYLWVHVKNAEALEFLSAVKDDDLNYFWHENDSFTLTSMRYPWIYPGCQLIKNGVAVLPERYMPINNISKLDVFGVCSDFVALIR